MADMFQYTGAELESLGTTRNYWNCVLQLSAPYFGSRIIEVGAGIGSFSSSMRSA